MVAGGDIGDGDGASAIAELYDPATGAFSRSNNMTAGREQDTATLLSVGTVLFANGDDERYWILETILSSAELTPSACLLIFSDVFRLLRTF